MSEAETGLDEGRAAGSPSRREFLGVAGMAVAAGHAHQDPLPESAQRPDRGGAAPSRGTVLAIGSHYDDAPFGIPGLLLQAVARGHRVVVLSLIGDYSNWKPVRGRGEQLVEGTRRIAADYGVESRFLGFASGRLETGEAARRAVSEVVAELQPDVAFALWPRDHHPDHEAASQLSQLALRLGDRLLPDPFARFRTPSRLYYYDNGPRHTIGFEPDTFVDVTPQWPRAIEWLGRLMALVRDEQYVPGELDGAQRAKEALARYRGFTCGAGYAEALSSANAYPQELFPPS
jgi:LmbE family N-acetylglucosaminyl deacetylase